MVFFVFTSLSPPTPSPDCGLEGTEIRVESVDVVQNIGLDQISYHVCFHFIDTARQNNVDCIWIDRIAAHQKNLLWEWQVGIGWVFLSSPHQTFHKRRRLFLQLNTSQTLFSRNNWQLSWANAKFRWHFCIFIQIKMIKMKYCEQTVSKVVAFIK